MSELKFKEDAEEFVTSDFWYDITSGGYIKPEDFLEKESAEEVKKAIELLRKLERELEENGLMDYM